METTYIWEEITEGQTKMQLINAGNPSGFMAILQPFMKMAMRSANSRDLKKLKSILES